MSKWFVIHEGTGTYFSIDDDAFLVDVDGLTDDEIEGLEWLDVPDNTPIIPLNSRLIDKWTNK